MMINSPLNQCVDDSAYLTDYDLVRMHHQFMLVYGWVPLAEFKSLPLPTLFQLNVFVVEELGKRESLRLCTLKFYGVKNPK